MIINAVNIGKELNLTHSEMEELILTCKLHDVGKIGIDESILLKTDNLSEVERHMISKHTHKGYRILKASGILNGIAKNVLTHHERWDGTGYPMGLRGENIPLEARIVSVVDAYDIMIYGSVYKKPISKEEAIKELKKCSGNQFDPEIVEIFIEILNKELSIIK